MASGNEGGADLNLWRPGGKTDNGINEAIIDPPPKADINATSYVTPGKTLSRSDLNAQISANIATDFKNHPLRVAYEEEVAALSRYADLITPDMTAEALETLAREANLARRELGVKYKDVTAKPLRDYIYDINNARYNDPLGPTYQYLSMSKTDFEILAGASRPNPDVNVLLDGFSTWLATKSDDYIFSVKEYW